MSVDRDDRLALARQSLGETLRMEDDVRTRILAGRTLRECILALEKTLIEEVLAACGDNRAAAAGALGIARESLFNKLRIHGIPLKRILTR